MSKFTIINDVRSHVKKFGVVGRNIVFKINNAPKNEDPVKWLQEGVEEVVSHAMSDVGLKDKIGFTFTSDEFQERLPGYMSFRDADSVTYGDVWSILAKIFQSNSDAVNTDKFRITMTHVIMPKGVGRIKSDAYNTFDQECKKRVGIITINNRDNLCLPRALVVAKAHAKKDPYYKQIRENTAKIQDSKTSKLLMKSGIIIPKNGAGVSELLQFQLYFKKYKIVVYKYGTKGRDLIFKGENNNANYTINLLYHENHYNVITSLTAAFSCSYYCQTCQVPFNTKNRHRCASTCPCCQQTPACIRENLETHCAECNREFRNDSCFANHKKAGSLNKGSLCDQIKRCKMCLKIINLNIRKEEHICGEIYCKICQAYRPAGHHCFMQQNKSHPKTSDTLFVFFDLETMQQKSMPNDTETKIHEPNLCVLMQSCDVCLSDTNLYFCQKCGFTKKIIEKDVIHNFMKYLLEIRNKFKKVICIAHNGQNFDAQFVLSYILHRTQLKPILIMRGSKILMLELGNIRFIDSLNFFPMALRKLPKAFALSSNMKKGNFPHLFNTTENQTYVGELPDVAYYSPGSMRPDEREEFLNWYNEAKTNKYIFDLHRDLVEYCVSDVQILKAACLKFMDMFLKECDVCPFSEAITIASACNLVFRRKFLQPNTIGIIPKNGYRNADNQSKIALQWLTLEEINRNIIIQHAGRCREVIIPGTTWKVDGFCLETNQIFEFHGCYYHGHTCMTSGRDLPLHDAQTDTLNTRFERTKMKIGRLLNMGYEIIETWECDFRRMIHKNPSLKFLDNHPVIRSAPLNPRDAFYGGRTGNTRLHYKTGNGEKIKYIDVCSLYPWCCKYAPFPIAHPRVHVGDECKEIDLQRINGLIKCKILPPQGLYHPVLPLKMHDKLLFLLCRSCGEQENQGECSHTHDERALFGTWVIDEVRKALEKGYKIITIYEVWEYNIVQHNRETEGLFTAFINKFLKIKQEASGFPANCSTKEEQDMYIEDYLKHEGIQLELERVANNPGLRSLAKLMLNSFWGKFGQTQNQSQTKIVSEPHVLLNMLTNPSIEVNNIQEVNEESIIINWQFKDEAADILATVNVVIAAFVTTHARLKLYSCLEELGERVLYYDTDSIIYISRENEFDPPLGNYLGDFTDEVEEYGPGSYITEFISGGPKNYGYVVYSPIKDEYFTRFKVKGITLNYKNSQTINLDILKHMVLSNERNTTPILAYTRSIRRTKDHEVITKTETKTFKINCKKRRMVEDYNSVPYGYKS